MRIEFRRAAGDVDRFALNFPSGLDHHFHCRPIHCLFAFRRRGDVAMHASLVAFQADIDLNDVDARPAQIRAGSGLNCLIEFIHDARAFRFPLRVESRYIPQNPKDQGA